MPGNEPLTHLPTGHNMTCYWYFSDPFIDLLFRYQFLELFTVRTIFFFLEIQPQNFGKLGVVRSEDLHFWTINHQIVKSMTHFLFFPQ